MDSGRPQPGSHPRPRANLAQVGTGQKGAEQGPNPRPCLGTPFLTQLPTAPRALSIPRGSQNSRCLPQGAPKPGQLDSAARNLPGAPQARRGTRGRHCACARCGQPSLTLHPLPTAFHYSTQTQHGPWEIPKTSRERARCCLCFLSKSREVQAGQVFVWCRSGALLVPRVPGRWAGWEGSRLPPRPRPGGRAAGSTGRREARKGLGVSPTHAA